MKNQTVVALGDSLTFGYGIPKKHTLTTKLQLDFPDYKVLNKGINGDTSLAALARVKDDVIAENPDIVTIWLGSNDCFLPQNHSLSLTQYETNIINMIEKIKKDTTATIFLLTLPPMSDNQWDDNFPKISPEEIANFATATRNIAKQMDCTLIDFHDQIENNPEKETFFQHDGLHLNEHCYAFLYESFKHHFQSLI